MSFMVLCNGCGRWYKFDGEQNDHHCNVAVEESIERGRKRDGERMLYEYRTFADRLSEADAMNNAVEA